MTVFGDDVPEDRWDHDDDPAAMLDDLIARAVALNAGAPRPQLVTLEDVAAFVFTVRHARQLDHAELIRADLLDEDVAYLRSRID